MKNFYFGGYFDELSTTVALCFAGALGSFLFALPVYAIVERIFHSLKKPAPDHLYWWILLGFVALLAGCIVVHFLWCLYYCLADLVQNVHDLCLCKKRGHDWDERLRCRRCGEVMPHEHNWDGCRCTFCGERRDEGHVWNGCTCRRCGMTREEGHEWIEHTCPNCGGTGFVPPPHGSCLSYGDPGYGDPDYQEPCDCHQPTEYECKICGRRR